MDRTTLKKWFRTGAKPTEAQFAELIDSFRHVDEKLSVSDVENLSALIAEKMTRADALSLHKKLEESIAKLDEEKTTAGDVQAMIDATHAEEPWGAESDLNDYTETGVYQFAGWRKNAADNLPITNYDEDKVERNNVAFTLVVNVQEGYFDASVPRNIPTMIAQTLMLGNRRGSDTKLYTRHGQIDLNKNVTTWGEWKEVMTSTYLGIVDSYTGEVLNNATEIGLYTGAVVDMANMVADVFKLEVINNYSVTTQVSAAMGASVPNSVLQTLTTLNISGGDAVRRRTGVWNGNGYVWSEWETSATGVSAALATQNVPGLVRGGRNVRIEQDGSANVDEIYFKNTDTDTSDGALDDSIVRVNPNVTIEEAMYNHQDKSGSTLSLYEEVGLFHYEITATSDSEYRDFTLASAIATIRPNTTAVLVQDIWRRAYERFLYLCANDYSDYTTLQELRSGLCRYPYYTGYYKFELMLSEGTAKSGARFYLTSRDGVRQGELEHVGNGVYELRISSFKETADTYTMDFSKLLPFRIEADYTGSTVWDYNGVSLCIHTVQRASSEVVDEYNSRVLFGIFQKTTEDSDGYTDRTRNVLLCRDGILLQGRNQSCYIRINDEGNIETNIGEFITQ